MDLIRTFQQVGKDDAGLVGGKGASLGEMTQAGIPVPPGFVITAQTFERFLHECRIHEAIDAILHKVDVNVMHTIDQASEEIKSIILSAEMPAEIAKAIMLEFKKLRCDFVAVRSSATAEDSSAAAWAGQLDSYLNTTEETLLENVKKCWASLFTPRAIFYRHEKNLHETHISVAVVVQKMVASEVSGIAFSVHPVTQDYNQLIIEAGIGLGEAIVSGQITPDSYVIEKKEWGIIEKNVSSQTRGLYRGKKGGNEWKEVLGDKQKISDSQIIELAKLIVKIEQHYGFPVDVEWALEKNQFFIVQSRPITTLMKKDNIKNISLVKTYTRDTTLIIQQAWAKSCTDGFFRITGKKNPYNPTIIHYLNDGTIEIWENVQAIEWIKKTILERNKKEKDFLNKIITNYKGKIKRLTGQKLPEITKIVFEIIDYFVIWYYTALEKRTPSSILKKALSLREKDAFFADADQLLRAKILKNFPQLKGLENTILKEEILCLPAMDVLQQRKKHFVLVDGAVTSYSTLQDYVYFNHIQIQEEKVDVKEGIIRGQIGYNGRVQGYVHILKRQEQIEEVKEGEIIVSPMTIPQFLPAIKKAAGIVTDEGGQLCHAAIVARELKKPCIIGTKIATKVLKDGDLVEVDGEKGIVKILNENLLAKDNKKMMINLQSREHSLVYFFVWQKANQEYSADFFRRVRTILFINKGVGKTSVWYEEQEIKEIFEESGKRATTDRKYFDHVKKDFYKYFEVLISYIKGEKKIRKISNLKEYYEAYLKWWAPMAILYVLPESKTASKEIQKAALKIRSETEKYSDENDLFFIKSFNKLFPQYVEISHLLTPDEVFRCAKGLSKEQISKIKPREKGYVLYNGSLYHFGELGEIVKKHNLVLQETEVQKGDSIIGQVAFKGSAKGFVRIIHSKKQLEDFKEGEVLVTEMTSPDYVPFMKQAAAIITDEGGVNCHAAIVAREMKIPCVVGTRNATSMLRDGDLVKIDPERGVVNIIEKAAEEKALLINPEEWEFEFQQRTSQPILMADLWCKALYHNFVQELNLSTPPLDYLFTTEGKGYVKKEQKRIIIDEIKKSTLVDDQYTQYVFETTQKRIKLLQTVCEKIAQGVSVKNVSKKKIADLWVEFDATLTQIIPWFFIPWYFTEENILSDKVKEGLLRHRDAVEKITDVQNVLMILIFPVKKVAFQEEQLKFIELVRLAQKKKEFEKDKQFLAEAHAYLRKYAWTTTYIVVPAELLSLEQLICRIKEAIQNKSVEQYTLQEQQRVKNRMVADSLLRVLKSDPDLIQKIEWARKYAWLLTWSVEQALIATAQLLPFYKLIAKALGIPYTKWVMLTSDEIVQGLKTTLTISQEELKQREQNHVLLLEKGKVWLRVGEEGKRLSQLIDSNVGEIKGEINEIKGQPACPGMAKGRVCKALNPHAAARIKQGEILVCSMTSPEYVPAMKKAAAIVTDEGGLLSHAAIMSRELGRPCLVGTKIATKVLKDGDLVEIDVKRGIVYKLKH